MEISAIDCELEAELDKFINTITNDIEDKIFYKNQLSYITHNPFT
jgi:hypothetical protein